MGIENLYQQHGQTYFNDLEILIMYIKSDDIKISHFL